MNESFGAATNGSIALHGMVGTNKPSYAAIFCPNLLISPSTAKSARKGQKWRFGRVPTTKGDVTGASLKVASRLTIVLDAIVESIKHSYVQLTSASQ